MDMVIEIFLMVLIMQEIYYITNPIIQQQVSQQRSKVLIPMDTLQFCNPIGDKACVFIKAISNYYSIIQLKIILVTGS